MRELARVIMSLRAPRPSREGKGQEGGGRVGGIAMTIEREREAGAGSLSLAREGGGGRRRIPQHSET